MIKIVDLFATPVAVFDNLYPDYQTIAAEATKVVDGLTTPPGWNCDIASSFKVYDQVIEQLPPDFKQAILDAANQYSVRYWKQKCKIANSWVNKASSNQYQEQHNHITAIGACQFSGVYYPQIQLDEKLTFHSPYNSIALIDQGMNRSSIGALLNRLIVFPSYLEHSFKAIERTTDKISIAINFKI